MKKISLFESVGPRLHSVPAGLSNMFSSDDERVRRKWESLVILSVQKLGLTLYKYDYCILHKFDPLSTLNMKTDTVLVIYHYSAINDYILLWFSFQMIHNNVIDTSVVFPHKLGPPHKRALRTLMADFLKKLIQQDGKL